MTLASGTKLGPYEILAPIGAGGMGEVYRARDPRLTREVAIKVLPATFSQDPDRLKRFEAEARAAGVLNHPNITAVYDFGTHDAAPYIVTELLEGETLRSRLGPGAISPRKAIDYAVQIAKGLAAAHEKGIVHRDLKPENVFLTKDGRVKILDFGLAKLKLDGGESGQTDAGTVSGGTQPGVVLGTMGYMSPEQVRGKPADRRSDLFSFGTILYEMLAGQRAFRGDTAADTITAILTKEPPDLSQTNKDVPRGWIGSCGTAWRRTRRSASSRRATSLSTSRPCRASRARPRRPACGRCPRSARGAAGWLLPSPRFSVRRRRPLRLLCRQKGRFRRAAGLSADHVLARRGRRRAIRAGRPDGRLLRRLGGRAFRGLHQSPREPRVAAVRAAARRGSSISKSGEMAVSLNRRPLRSLRPDGPPGADLDRGRRAAGHPRRRPVRRLGPDGQTLTIVRDVGVKNRLEYPIGKVLFETTGWIGNPRVSPKGDVVAFSITRFRTTTAGASRSSIAPARRRDSRRSTRRSRGSSGRRTEAKIWYTAAEGGFNRAVHAVTFRVESASGGPRAGHQHDPRHLEGRASADDQRERATRHPRAWSRRRQGAGALLARLLPRHRHLSGRPAGSSLRSPARAAVRATPRTCARLDGSPAIRLGEGSTEAFSPDGAWAISITSARSPQIILLRRASGSRGPVPRGHRSVQCRLPAGRKADRLHRDPGGAAAPGSICATRRRQVKPLTPEGYSMFRGTITPDEKVRGRPRAGSQDLPVSAGRRRADGASGPRSEPPARAIHGRRKEPLHSGRPDDPVAHHRYDMATGKVELWKEIMVADAAGLNSISRFVVTPDGKSYAYSYLRVLSYLQLVDGHEVVVR